MYDYKFEVGDVVETVKCGYGVDEQELHTQVKIVEKGDYGGDPGYKVYPPIGNTKNGWFDGFIGEETFKLVENKFTNLVDSYVNSRDDLIKRAVEVSNLIDELDEESVLSVGGWVAVSTEYLDLRELGGMDKFIILEYVNPFDMWTESWTIPANWIDMPDDKLKEAILFEITDKGKSRHEELKEELEQLRKRVREIEEEL